MTAFKSKAIAGVLAIAMVAVAAYWYWSPFLAIRQLQSAAQAQDADAFNDRVDYPKLRESLKGQFSAMMLEKAGNNDGSERGFAALGAALAMAMVNPMVDALVRPESVMQAMRNGKFSRPSDPQSTSEPQSSPANSKKKPQLSFERKSVDKLIAYAPDPDNANTKKEEGLALVFERSGFANWKLTELRVPVLKK